MIGEARLSCKMVFCWKTCYFKGEIRVAFRGRNDGRKARTPKTRRCSLACSFVDCSLRNCRKTYLIGGAERDRTADLLVANEALSQLSYSPHRRAACHRAVIPASASLVSLAGRPQVCYRACASGLSGLGGSLQAKLGHYALEVFPGFALLARVTQKKRRMVGHGNLRSSTAMPSAAQGTE